MVCLRFVASGLLTDISNATTQTAGRWESLLFFTFFFILKFMEAGPAAEQRSRGLLELTERVTLSDRDSRIPRDRENTNDCQ